MRHGIRCMTSALASLLCAAGAGSAQAQFPAWMELPDELLAEQRGGFITPGGLQINFSFENVVRVNGELQVHTILTLDRQGPLLRPAADADTAAATAAQLPAPPQVAAEGPSGAAVADAAGTSVLTSGLQTIIQNRLDQQRIESVKLINIEIASVRGLARSGLIQRLQTGVVDSLR